MLRSALSLLCFVLVPISSFAGSSEDLDAAPPSCDCRAYPNEGSYVVAGQTLALTYEETGDPEVCPSRLNTMVEFPEEGAFDLNLYCEGTEWRGTIAPPEIAQMGEFTFILTPLFDEPTNQAELLGLGDLAVRNSNSFRLELLIPPGIAAMGKRPARTTMGESSGAGRAPECMCHFAQNRLEYIEALIGAYTDPAVHERARAEGVMGIASVASYLDDTFTLRDLDMAGSPSERIFSTLAIAEARAARKGERASADWGAPTAGGGRNIGGYVDPVSCDIVIVEGDKIGESCKFGFELRESVVHEAAHARQCREANAESFYTNPGFGRVRFPMDESGDWINDRPSSAFAGLANLPARLGDFEAQAYEEGRREVVRWMVEHCPS